MVIVSLPRFNSLITAQLYLHKPKPERAAELLEDFNQLPGHVPSPIEPGLDLSHPFVVLFLPDCVNLLRAYAEEDSSRVSELHPIVFDWRFQFTKLLHSNHRARLSCYGVCYAAETPLDS